MQLIQWSSVNKIRDIVINYLIVTSNNYNDIILFNFELYTSLYFDFH